MRAKLILAAVAVFAIAAAVFFLTRRYFPRVEVETKVEFRDRPLARRDTARSARPETQIIYLPGKERIIRDTVWIPQSFRSVGVIDAHAIRFNRGDVVLTYFADSSFVQNRYRIPRPRTSYGVFAFTAYDPFRRAPVFGLEASFRYRAFSVFARQSFAASDVFSEIGIRIRLKGKE